MTTYVQHRFHLDPTTKSYLRSLTPQFGYNGLGELIFYRTYSRTKPDGSQENWADTVIRVTEGTFSIRKDWYLKNHLQWDEEHYQDYARSFATSMFRMEWLPPGRGLWAMGTDFIYERGSMSLYSCAFTLLKADTLAEDLAWLMDCLMLGVGVGFVPERDALYIPGPKGKEDVEIQDSREGWVESVQLLVDAYLKAQPLPVFDYSTIRPAGKPIKGFGGVASGPWPLIDLHRSIVKEFENYKDVVYLKTNLANLIGKCVVAGNVRRSAEIALGAIDDPIFKNLKDYDRFPEREAFGWLSNNSVILDADSSFDKLGEIAEGILRNGEPGFVNRRNFKFGRVGRPMDGLRIDKAVGVNPCGEVVLEDKETCNIAETFPTVGDNWYQACGHAAFYCTTVSLLPTHQPRTNAIVARNRRIGIGIVDFTGWKQKEGVHRVIRMLRHGYQLIRETADLLNDEAGIPHPIRYTTVKPGGTTPKLPGRTSGAGHPTFSYTLRRIRIAKNSPIHPLLVEAGIPYEDDAFDPYTDCFEFPILQGPALPADRISLWEQAFNLVTLQREWADNAVSNTLYFKPKWVLKEVIKKGEEDKLKNYRTEGKRYKIVGDEFQYKIYEYDPNHEEHDVEPVLSMLAPVVKSVSMLPHTPKGVYRQMPEEAITKEEYEERLKAIKPIDWSKLRGSDGMDEKYCQGDRCEIQL